MAVQNNSFEPKSTAQWTIDRPLRSASNFWKFSPKLLYWRLLPRWVLVSLAVNGVLSVGMLLVLLWNTSAPKNATIAPANAAAEVVPPSPSPSGERHQLTYQQWVEQLAREAEVMADQPPSRLAVLAGDSISLWFPPELLPAEQTWLNQGISGETSVGLLQRLDLFDRTTPEVIFVLVGINDLIHGVEDDTLLANHQEIIETLKEAHPDSQIVVQSILPHAGDQATWEGKTKLLSISNDRIQSLNEQLREIAASEEVEFLDLYPLFANEQGNLRREFTTDGLHLSDQGYQVWRTTLQLYDQLVLAAES